MKESRLFLSIFLLFVLTDMAGAQNQWINNITVSEYNITWGYTEIYTGMDSIRYRINIDTGPGNNDSFVNAWEVLEADREARQKFKSSLQNEPDIRIDNGTSGIEIMDVESSLSQVIIGNTNISDTIENRYTVTYGLKESIYNASSVWFLGEPDSSATIILPEGIDVADISGMDNETKNIDLHTEVTGFFSNLSNKRGEITINITKNESYNVTAPESNITENLSLEINENITEPASGISEKLRNWSLIGIGIVFIVLIYVFKVRKKM